MSLSTNIPLNSRTMSGIILISDGVATLSEGDLTCDDVVSNTVVTGNMTTNNLTCKGELRSNTNGPYSIPTAPTSITGSLISYGNNSNTGATDITNYGSTYNLLKQGFYFNNINSTTALTNLAIIDNTQTYFKSQLTGCVAETPLNPTSVVNKSYVDNNFVDRVNNLTQDINGLKTFTNDLTVFNTSSPSLFLRTALTGNSYSYIRSGVSLAINNQLPTGSIIFQINTNTRATINSTQLLLASTTFLTTNDMKSRDPTASHSLLSDITTGTLSISSSTATNTINGNTQLNQQTTFNNFTPISNIATPTAVNHLTRKDYVDNNFLDRVNNLTQSINGQKTFLNNIYTETIIMRDGLIWQDVLAPKTNWVQSYVAGSTINFNTLYNLGRYAFNTRDSLSNQTTSFEISNPETIIRNNLISNGQATFNNFTPISNVSTPTAVNHLTRKDYVDNNFVDKTSDQTIGGSKTFTVDITAHNLNISAGLYILDLINISNPNNSRIYHQGTTLNFQPNANYSNNYYFYCNGYPYVRFSENFTALDCNTSVSNGKSFYTNNISPNDGTATQSIYTGLTSGTINIGSSSSYCNINSLSVFSKLLTVENLDLSFVGDAYINCPNATGLSLFLALTTQTIGLFSNLTTAIVNFCSSSVFTTMFNLNARIKHKQTQILNEVKHISGTSATLTLPLEQTLMLSATGSTSIAITLPLLNSSHHAGFTFNVIKTGSTTNSVSFTASGSNLIRAYGSITGVSTLTQMAGIETIINIYTLEVSTGNFVWALY